eukprot:gb/GFBE01010872.1/.p1 GENE.gb/GFBE01010872.1/~~gb/GFBE01010872.1/.p1  ORF type:complete len:587 (+),score=118.18 gb/GFBE01010872.1/:1-1761(+)
MQRAQRLACCVESEKSSEAIQIQSMPTFVTSASSLQSRKVVAWLEDSLDRERKELEARHEAMRADLSLLLARLAAGREAEVDTHGADMADANDDLFMPVAKETDRYLPGNSGDLKQSDGDNDAISETREGEEGVNGVPDIIEEATPDIREHQAEVAVAESQEVEAAKNYAKKRSSLLAGDDDDDNMPLVKKPWFESLFCILIIVNTLVMGVDIQYRGLVLGAQIGYPKFTDPDVWPGARTALFVTEWIFGVVFTVELCLKIFYLKQYFFLEAWNLFDSLIILCWLLDTAMNGVLPIDPMLLRLARLGRLMRLVRLVRTIEKFDALYVMATALKGSISVLFWAFCLFLVVQLMVAFFLNSLLVGYMEDENNTIEQRHKIFGLFGTCSRAILTMFELTVGNWVPVARILLEDVSPYWVIFSIFHKLTIGFAVVGVVNGVFMQETFKVSSNDDTIQIRQAEHKKRNHMNKMQKLFQIADNSGDGVLTESEFLSIVDNPKVKSWLSAQELNVHDPEMLFRLIDSGAGCAGEVSAEQFVTGVGKLKGPARSMDLLQVMFEMRDLRSVLQSVHRTTEQVSSRVSQPEIGARG